MERNVVLLFDGTWNNSQDETNVALMRKALDSSGEHDPVQPCLYLSGVGTSWHNWLTGGLFGRGLSENIQKAYAWLSTTHGEGDRLFVFGFSRGAYTARSLVGLARKCGLLNDMTQAKPAYALYRDKRISPDHPRAQQFRQRHSREIRVRFIGVWDTVGSLGVPMSGVPFGKDYYRWHDTSLSKIVDYAYHAIAADERRADYRPAVWTSDDRRKKPENIEVEQRWFVGAHSNVGGGYHKRPPDCLPKIALRWIQDKAEGAGLKLREKSALDAKDCMAAVNDSYREFAYGAYALLNKPYKRLFGKGVNETVDPSVWRRWAQDPKYRPASLRGHPDHPAALSDEDIPIAET